ncbi:MAG: hypothetical protein GDA49_09770 [Rhodospirillales bacterium]|nr:hypothetical protein [Rhodospirillales bacterium]
MVANGTPDHHHHHPVRGGSPTIDDGTGLTDDEIDRLIAAGIVVTP